MGRSWSLQEVCEVEWGYYVDGFIVDENFELDFILNGVPVEVIKNWGEF